MDSDVYNEIETGFADDLLQFGQEDVQNEPDANAVNALNNVQRRPPKRILVPDECDAIDWHMRVMCSDNEKENKIWREMLNDEVVERLTERISFARKKRCIINLRGGEDNEQDVSSTTEENEVFYHPPSGGIPWIGFTDPLTLQRFYLKLKNTAPTVNSNSNDMQRFGALNFGYTRKVLESGVLFEVPDIIPEDMDVGTGCSFNQDELWVEKYAPHSYADLVSDESVNRLLLNWIRLWDECVFQKTVPDVVLRGSSNQKLMLSNEKPRRPLHKVVLVAGPAGAGKTTLATLVARHVGYRVISLNASDERNQADFEKCFEDALRTTQTLDAGFKPNCLILDEIDGAPVQSIHYLCKAVNATGRRSLRRPVICICNNLYTPSLRELRAMALVLQLPRTDERDLARRLEEISIREHLKFETSALTELVDACSRDLRSSINALQFISAGSSGPISRKSVLQFCEIEKHFGDKSLFNSWASVFEVSRHLDANGRVQSAASRIKQITFLAEQHGGEIDRFYMGLFNNYLNSKNTTILTNILMVIHQFNYYDRLITSMNISQDYNLLKYMAVACVGIHLLLCSRGRVHLSFPTEHQNALQRHQQSVEIVESVRAGAVQKNLSLSTVALEILPYLASIVQPEFKPMNAQLYSARELNLLRWIVSVMRSYSLTYSSVKQDDTIKFVFKPAIDQLVMFADDDACRNSRSANTLSKSARQLIAHEIELDKLRKNVDVGSSVPGLRENLQEIFNKRNKLSAEITYSHNQGTASAIRRNIKMKEFLEF